MRLNVLALVREFAKSFPIPEPVMEIGSFQVPGQVGFADLRPFFPGRPYVGCDMRPGPGVDRVEDAHHLTFADGSIGTVLSADTLEHIANPIVALGEMKRVLRPDGLMLITSVMDFPIHDYPSDYWRFTPAAFRLLLEGLPFILIGYEGDPSKPHTVVGLGARVAPSQTALDGFAARTPGTVWIR